MRWRRTPKRGPGVVVVELALVGNGVPIIYLPPGSTTPEQERIVCAWVEAMRESMLERADIARQIAQLEERP